MVKADMWMRKNSLVNKRLGDKMSKIVFLLVGLACFILVSSPAFAQQDQTEESDIEAVLAKITGPDPIQRALATQEALSSSNQILRSTALDTALASQDGEVRETALFYLANVQKQFIVTITLPPSDPNNSSSDSSDDKINNDVLDFSPVTLQLTSIDPNTLTFHFGFPQGASGVGSITRDGLSFVIGADLINTDINMP
jgi:hypothetical protein